MSSYPTNKEEAKEELLRYVAQNALAPSELQQEIAAPYLELFKNMYGEKLEAVIFYGSKLSEKISKETSTPDFVVITTDGILSAHSFMTRLLHCYVPPASQSRDLRQGNLLFFKYLHIDAAQFKRLTEERVKDLFLIGRLSKYVKIVYYKDEAAKNIVAGGLGEAVLNLIPLVCSLLPVEFTRQRYMKASMALSYQGEVRIETEGKIDALLNAFTDYYEGLFERAIAVAEAKKLIIKQKEDFYKNLTQSDDKKRALRLLSRSKFLGLLRWPKHFFTVKHWSELGLQKIERMNPDFKFNPFHRRHPLIFALPYLIYFIMKGYIRTHKE